MSRRRLIQSQGGELPRGYVRCKYLESSGHQYVDTNIIHPLFIKASITRIGDVGTYFGTVDSNFYRLIFYQNKFSFQINDGNTIIQLSNGYEFEVIINENHILINDKYETFKANKTIKNMYLFAGNIHGSAGSFNKCRIKSIEFGDGIILSRNYIPALDKTGRPCMYDSVTQQPFYNQGTGEFGYELPDGTYVAPI